MELKNREGVLNLGEQHYRAMHDFAFHVALKRVQGEKLAALYRPIRSKRKPLGLNNNHLYNGMKTVEFGEQDLIILFGQGFSSYYSSSINENQ